MLADRVRMRLLDVGVKPEDIADENCQVATDNDFFLRPDGNFLYIGTATRLVIPHVIQGVPVTSYAGMFSGRDVIEVRSNNPNITDMSYMFQESFSITSLDLSIFDTSNVTNMSSMFDWCTSLTSLDLSGFDTSKVTNMSGMFYNCTSITTAYARTQADADKFNASSGKPSNVNFVVK